MASMLKTFGIGLLCTVLSPLILLVFVLYFIYTLLGTIVMFGINTYKYFAKGGSVLDELAIEKKARQILTAQEEYNQKMREAALNNINPLNTPQMNQVHEENNFNNPSETIENKNTEYNYESPNNPYGGDSQ
ncbi:MAG: hypothetical protein J1F31_05220 [Erysipelotrichales bacterium]|nr:hypothetical protein [Erysipelotrichales bacterium]